MSKRFIFKEYPHVILQPDLNYQFDNVKDNSTSLIPEKNQLEIQPEKRLWLTVLILGIKGMLNGDSEDIEWYNSDNYGFNWCCELLNLNPDRIKKIIKESPPDFDNSMFTRFPINWYEKKSKK